MTFNDETLKRRIGQQVRELGVYKASPGSELIDGIFTLDPVEGLGALTLIEIASYITALSQYLIFVTYKRNMVEIRRAFLRKQLDKHVRRAMPAIGKAGTKEERERQIIDMDDDMLALEEELELLTAEMTLVEDLPDAVKEYINALKKYRETKEFEMKVSRYEEHNV